MPPWTVYIHDIEADDVLCAVVDAAAPDAAEDAAAEAWGLTERPYLIVATLPGVQRDRRNTNRFKDARPASAHRAMADAAMRARAERVAAAVRRLLARAGYEADVGPDGLRPASGAG